MSAKPVPSVAESSDIAAKMMVYAAHSEEVLRRL